MRLGKKNMILVSFMMFSLFFGAGNLIFPPFLGQNAGSSMVPAMLGFITTAVVLPMLGVVVIARFEGLDNLGKKVGSLFALVFSILIYISIGPGLAIPRAASVPFEMAVAPYLPESANATVWMAVYSLVFFAIAFLMCLNPGKLVGRIGKFLTPTLLCLLLFLFLCFLVRGQVQIAAPQPDYESKAVLKGFLEGYQTMDAIAALNFGLVIATTIHSFGVEKKSEQMKYTVLAGVFAGGILAAVYLMLSYMGMCSSGVYEIQENGAWTLRCIVYQIFGAPGAILLAAIFTLACLTACIGLINSISLYFSRLCKKIPYRAWAFLIVAVSFVICNLGLTAILKISIPILNIIYPVAIVLILLGLTQRFWEGKRFVYPLMVTGTAIASILHGLDSIHVPLGILTVWSRHLPLYEMGFCWVSVSVGMLLISLLLNIGCKKIQNGL